MTLHIATSHEFGGVIARTLRTPVCFVTENLLLGPCAGDPEEHARVRSDFWNLRGQDRARFRAAFRDLGAAIQSRDRLVLWTTRSLADTAALWWLCAWRLLHRPLQPTLDLVVLGPDPGTAIGLDRINIRVRADDVRRGLDQFRPLSLTRARRMARGWRKLTGHAPLSVPAGGRVDQDRRDLLDLAAYEAGFFPRLTARGLALSRFDELIFSCLGDDGLTPVEVFVHDSVAGKELRRWMPHTGDVLLATRLAQWAEHRGEEAALQREPVRPENAMMAARYRLSKVGKAIRRRGLQEIAQGPPLPVFGAVAYAPLAPWAVVGEQGGSPRLELYE
ncbi:MAG: hypothetical protein QM820_14440 [Minicystis sp.]